MPALNFKARWADKVESGEKPHTIRALRKRPFKVGDRVYLYTGMRTRTCRKLGESDCIRVEPIKIGQTACEPLGFVEIGKVRLFAAQIMALARNDGFEALDEFFDFFVPNGGVFEGQFIEWTVPIS